MATRHLTLKTPQGPKHNRTGLEQILDVLSNAFGSSLSTSIVPPPFPSASNTGTIISERVEPKAVRYRASANTSPTLTICFCAMAALVSPLVSGNVGYSGAAGPLQVTFLTRPAA